MLLRHLLICALLTMLTGARAEPPALDKILADALERGERTWADVNSLPPELSSRELFGYSLVLCEAGQHLDRLERIFTVAARMQDRDPESRGYGNFRWRWKEGAVMDFNAVEFCMQSATLMWLRKADAIPAPARQVLDGLFSHAVEGCLRHRVPSSYTNISLMNAANLILLGEMLGNPDAAREGHARLDAICLYTWQAGIHEYDSPTYYGVNLDDLLMVQGFCRQERGRLQAEALLRLLWTDIALNWFRPAQRLAGTCSRDYDYLRGRGFLETQLWVNGWLEEDTRRGDAACILPTVAAWRPEDSLKALSAERFPRTVRQKWGTGRTHARTHVLFPDVTLSSSGACYGSMDLPLTVNLPGGPNSLRCYFIPDGRRDPYGKKLIPAGPHEKTLHLTPFFAAAQRGVDALAVVVYREGDVPDGAPSLESHFVMPADVDGFWIGDKSVAPGEGLAAHPLQPGDALFLRKGSAAVGIRVPWSRSFEGGPAPAALVLDGNPYGAARLTVAHHSFWGVEGDAERPGAALWVRIGSGVVGDEAFAQWRRDFITADAKGSSDDGVIQVHVAGRDGPVALSAAPPFQGCLTVEPAHTKAVLELDGVDLGREILRDIEPIRSWTETAADTGPIAVSLERSAVWEAESAFLMAPMAVGEDDLAFGAKFAWTPGEPGDKGGGDGALIWKLKVEQAGQYYLWGRLLTPTPDDDSFFVRVYTDDAELIDNADWHTGSFTEWQWAPLKLGRGAAAGALTLPAGGVTLELRTREDGAAIDQLYITADPLQKPQ